MSTSTRRPRRIITGLLATVSLAFACFGLAASTATADTGDVCDICSLSFDPVACDEKGGQPYDSTEQNPDGTPLFPEPEPTQSPTPKPTKTPKATQSPTPKATQTTAPKPKATQTTASKPNPTTTTPSTSGSTSKSTTAPGTDNTTTDEDLIDETIAEDEELDARETDAELAASPTIVAVEGDLVPGSEVTVFGEGFPADDATLRVEIHSDVHVLGQVNVSEDGSFALTATVPEGIEPGAHELVVFADDVEIARTSVEITAAEETEVVEAAAASSDNSGTSVAGIALLGGLVVAGGGALAVHAIRKRKGTAAA